LNPSRPRAGTPVEEIPRGVNPTKGQRTSHLNFVTPIRRQPMRLLLSLLLILIPIAMSACAGHHPRDPHTIAKTSADGVIEGRPTLGVPISIPGHPTVLVPFSVESHQWFFESQDPYRAGGVPYESARMTARSIAWMPHYGGGVRWHNAIFRDTRSGEEWPLLERRGIVAQYQVLGHPPREDEHFVSRALLFIVVLEDTNRDGVLNDQDARVAILTDGDGRNPRIITPREGQVWGARYDPALDMLFLQVAMDTSGDGRYTFEDVATPWAVAITSRDTAAPLLSRAMVERAQSLLQTVSR
jgi:hypothetical protein